MRLLRTSYPVPFSRWVITQNIKFGLWLGIWASKMQIVPKARILLRAEITVYFSRKKKFKKEKL